LTAKKEIYRVKVLQLISSGGYYGAESMLLNLIDSDALAVSQNLLAVFHNRHCPNTELYDRAVERGVHAELVLCRGRLDRQGIQNVRRMIRANAIDLVHTHGYKADLYGYSAARLEGKPVVATCHNWLSGGAMLAVYNQLDRLVLKRFDAVSAVSQTVAEMLRSFGVRHERITVIPNGIDLQDFDRGALATSRSTPSGRERVIGIVGRLDMQKGFAYLIRALQTLHPSFPELRLLVVGEGPDRAKIEKLVAEQGLSSVVTIAGQQVDMPAVYAGMDIFVLPSLNEGLPMTLLEAMAASKPVIATRVGAVPTVIADGETGVLIEPADSAALTRAIIELLNNPERCRLLAQNARAQVERNYTAAAMTERYRELYRTVLARRGELEVQPVSTLAPGGRTSSAESGTTESAEPGSVH
jgi:glycosyltransferase involved in cell wall biosynthesis